MSRQNSLEKHYIKVLSPNTWHILDFDYPHLKDSHSKYAQKWSLRVSTDRASFTFVSGAHELPLLKKKLRENIFQKRKSFNKI